MVHYLLVYKRKSSRLSISSNFKIINLLDITLNLSINTFKPYHKDNDTPIYINVNSNQPHQIIRQIPTTVNTKINKLSSNKNFFDEHKIPYNDAFKK